MDDISVLTSTKMTTALSTVKDAINWYKEFVKLNPLVASEIESALRWISYLSAAANRVNSQLVSELLFSSASLMQLMNDTILRKACNLRMSVNDTVERLQLFLNVLEYVEVFGEFTARRFSTDVGKWIVIGTIQVLKAAIKMVLLLKFKHGMQRQLPIAPLNRQQGLTKSAMNGGNNNTGVKLLAEMPAISETSDEDLVTLERSGRVMRTLHNAPPRSQRTWFLPTDTTVKNLLDRNRQDCPPTELNDKQIFGEVLHIMRPLCHLTAVMGLGHTAWSPYLLSLGMDLTSLKLLNSNPDHTGWNVSERIEMGQRSFGLMLYLLRSPFYDRYTKERVLMVLRILSDHVPLFGRLFRPLINYLPEWQRTYFYVWGV